MASNPRKRADRARWPILVRLGLAGVPSRNAAWAYCWVSLGVAIAGVALGFLIPLAFFAALMVFAALWYYLCIRWVDRNGTW